MTQQLIRAMGWIAALMGTLAMASASTDQVLDFGDPAGFRQTIAVTGEQEWEISGDALYDPTDQTLRVTGSYLTRQAIEPDAYLSYRILDEAAEILIEDGARYAWERTPDNALRADFDLVILLVSEDPLRSAWTVEFNVVKEGEYWYRDRFPEIDFAALGFRNVPIRDHYIARAAWVPRYLPANFPARIPAWFSVGVRDEQGSGFQPSLDLNSTDLLTRTRSIRLGFEQMNNGTFWGWMPLQAQEPGFLLVRPGMAWENVRWYEAPDWFERERVEFVSPIWYVVVASLLGFLGWIGWSWGLGIRHRGLRWLGIIPLVGASVWWTANLIVSGLWPALLAVLLAGASTGSKRIPPRVMGYAFAWLFMGWVEVYWGNIEGTASIRGSAVMFSWATWAILLLPLLLIRSRRWSLGVSFGITAVWWLATVTGVVYYDFFMDFPSIGDLFYAGQIGQLGDSVGTLLTPRHWLPLWVWALMVLATFVGLGLSGKPKSKTQNT